MAYDNKFKQKVLDYLDQGHSQHPTAEIFGIGLTTLKTWRKQRASGTLFDVKIRNRKPKKIDPEKLKAYVSSHIDTEPYEPSRRRTPA